MRDPENEVAWSPLQPVISEGDSGLSGGFFFTESTISRTVRSTFDTSIINL